MAQEHQEYIQQKVNPILENLVTQLLLERPDQLAPFMIKWLTEHAKKQPESPPVQGGTSDADASSGAAAPGRAGGSLTELEILKQELKELQEEVSNLEKQHGATTNAGDIEAKGDEEEEESEEEDDDAAPDIQDMPKPDANYMKKNRTSVSAEAYGVWNQRKAFTPPVYEKTAEQKERIKSVLQESFLFSSLEGKELGILIDAMQEKDVEEGGRIIEQGDDGDCLYVIGSGKVNCYKKADGEEKLVKECSSGEAFGELALLYNCPRAASVVAAEKCTLLQLDRETFNHIVRDATTQRREKFESFLKEVPILKTMEDYERNTMCDALQVETVTKGTTVVRQGESGDKFYIVEEGDLKVEKVYVEGTPPQEVNSYGPGAYFGELSLIKNEPRAATVIAKTDCKLLCLSRRTFKLALGPIEDILRRTAETEYK